MRKGFTLVEILVTITVFAIVITAFFGLFGSAFRNQKKNLSSISLLNETSYLSEYMSRALRMARKDLGGICIKKKDNFEITHDGDGIKFLDYQGNCREFFLEDEILKVSKEGVSHNLTSSVIKVEGLIFEVLGQSQTDTIQPRITFVLDLKTTGESPQEIKLESTVSQRDLDIFR